MSTKILGVGGFGACRNPQEALKTFALGSCVALVLLNPETHTVGMVHIALPESHINPKRAEENPGYFADTGLPALLKKMVPLGCHPAGKGMIAKLAGGAAIMDLNETFNIGKRNVAAAKNLLGKLGIPIVAEETGGHISRTVSVFVNTGLVTLSSPGRNDWEI